METIKCNLDPSFEINEKCASWWVVFLTLRRHEPQRTTYHESQKLEYFKTKLEFLNFKKSLEYGHAFMVNSSHVQSCILVNDPEFKGKKGESQDLEITNKHEIELAKPESPSEERARLTRERKQSK